MATRKIFKQAPLDPNNSVNALTAPLLWFNIDGNLMCGPVFVDSSGFLRVRMPEVSAVPDPSERLVDGAEGAGDV